MKHFHDIFFFLMRTQCVPNLSLNLFSRFQRQIWTQALDLTGLYLISMTVRSFPAKVYFAAVIFLMYSLATACWQMG